MKKILFTTPELEHPPAGGPYLRIENSIKALHKISELHLVSRVSKEKMGGEVAEEFYKKNCSKFIYSPSVYKKKQNKIWRELKRIAKKILCQPKSQNADIEFLVDYVKKNAIDIIWFGYGNISHGLMKEVRRLLPKTKMVCDTDSVWSRFVLRGLPFATNEEKKREIEEEGREKERQEAEWVEFCDITTAVSEVDAEYYRSLTNNPSKIKVFSNVIDLDNYKNIPAAPEGFKKPCMYFAGYFGPHSPTDIAARWVINEILPLVKAEIPEIHFYIAGKGSDTTLADIKNPNITITGKLKTVLPYLCNADVSLVPLKFESGTRFKIIEAAACGIPIVSTMLGAEGLDVTDGEDILIADEPQEFADAVVKVIKNPEFAAKMASNCKKLIDKEYGLNTLVKQAEVILKEIK